jgi:integrase
VACLKGFYLHQASLGVNTELGTTLDRSRLPSRADRRRSFLGHVSSALPANPLAPPARRRRHPKMLLEGAREALLATVNSARDRLVVTWLGDGGLRVGELCGLHLVDLHLRRAPGAGSAGLRTCTSATARATRTVLEPRPSIPGASNKTP